nr:unnamed protein product [Callosobruchus analis]
MEVCAALFSILKEEVKFPAVEEDWLAVESGFHQRFPHCVGAIDGKHINVKAPTHSGSDFFNYKAYFSIVLLAVVDANYNFIYVNVGCQGRISDGGVFNNTSFKKGLEESSLRLPPSRALPGRTTLIPFVIVADDALPLSTNIMKPYFGVHEKGSKKRIFRYRLSRSRRVSENAFGALPTKFRVFRSPMELQPDKATKVTMTAVYLRNYLRKSSSKSIYTPVGMLDSESTQDGTFTPGIWRQDTSASQLRNFP